MRSGNRGMLAGVELRQGLYGGMACLGACCALRLPARGWSRASPRGDSPRQAARGLHGGATGAPFEGSAGRGEEGAPVGWVALVGGARAAAGGAGRRGGSKKRIMQRGGGN